MGFYGRKKELAILETEYAKASSYFALIGREGYGETALLREFAKDKPNVFFFSALKEIESQCKRRFIRTMAAHTGEEYLARLELDSWPQILDALAAYQPGTKKLVILDDTQYLVQANTDFLAILKQCWDESLCNKNIILITAGPLLSTTVQKYWSQSNLFQGGAVSTLHLRPFSFLEMCGYFEHLSFSQRVDIYTFTGGVPRYLNIVGDGTNLMDALEQNVLCRNGLLYEAPLMMLDKEVREPATYFSLMNTIAEGNTRLQEMARALSHKTNSLSPYLSLLIKLNLVERQVPVTEDNPDRSRKGKYTICDNFTNFWFKYVSTYRTELELDRQAEVRARLEEDYVESLVKPAYIGICTEICHALCESGAIPLSPTKTGSYWNGESTGPIDLIMLDEDAGRLLVADCLYLPEGEFVPQSAYTLLQHRRESITDLDAYSDVIHVLFTNRDFDPALQELARSDPGLYLVREADCL